MKIRPHQKIALIYVVLASTWIYVSDGIVQANFPGASEITLIQHLKGWFYVLFTGAILYVLVKRTIDRIEASNQTMLRTYEDTMLGWVHMMDLRHRETKDHTMRVARVTAEFARLAGLGEREVANVERGAVLHDVGKVGIPDDILIKPGPLSKEEFEIMKQHPVIAQELLQKIDFFKPCADIPYCHHEKWDGSGYPRGLQGEQIPFSARLFAVIDVWDALSNDRVYKRAWPEHEVLAYIDTAAGSHFDPQVVALFSANYPHLKRVAGRGDERKSAENESKCNATTRPQATG